MWVYNISTFLKHKHGPVSHVHIRQAAVEAISHLSPGPWEEVFSLYRFQRAVVQESQRCL